MREQHKIPARQPMFVESMKVAAYELLFCADNTNRAGIFAGNSATSQLFLNAFHEMDSSEIEQNHPDCINFTRNLFLQPRLPPKKHCVIEVLGALEVEEKLNRKLKALKESGYTIALDEFIFDSKWGTALKMADIVKVDALAFDAAEVERHVEQLKPFNVPPLAERVETHKMYYLCKGLGFKLFQGHFFSKPEQRKIRKGPSSDVVVQHQPAQLHKWDVELSSIAGMSAKGPLPSVKLIKLVRYAVFSGRRKMTWLQYAISLLAKTRAKMCQLLAKCFTSSASTDPRFSTVLLSNPDAFFDVEFKELFASMPLTKMVNDGLMNGFGATGQAPKSAMACRQTNWHAIDWKGIKELNIGARELGISFRASIRGA